MSEWREKEWDEPGPDFGKVFRRPARRIVRTVRPVQPEPDQGSDQPEKGSTS